MKKIALIIVVLLGAWWVYVMTLDIMFEQCLLREGGATEINCEKCWYEIYGEWKEVEL